jgi:NAD(P)-dependent dehydrogenase (short-subunit alcohol dehydrogenase family)
MEIQGSTFFISGGGSGLGAATASTLTEAGASVLIADVNEEAGKSLAAEIGERAKFVQTDVTDEQSVQDAVEAAVEAFGELHGAVNCAGIGPAARVLGKKGPHPLDLFEKAVQINLIGTFNVIRLAGARIAEAEPGEDSERGVIVNTASVAAYDGQIGQAAYSASKGGIVSMTLPVAREFARFGIRVVTIAPGTFNTPMVETLPEEARESLGNQVPFPSRLGEPVEFAMLAKHIIENR